MNTMYETLMSLPLFKGAGAELISAFLEKTHLSFESYAPGETVITPGESCMSVKSLLSGSCALHHPLFSGHLVVTETVPAGSMLGAQYLFGRDTCYNFSAVSKEKCGIMEFPKTQYFALLQTNQIFLMNYLNFLALRVQKEEEALASRKNATLAFFLSYIVDLTTNRNSSDISVESQGASVEEILFHQARFDSGEIRDLEEAGVIRPVSDRRLEIPSRYRLMEFAGIARS